MRCLPLLFLIALTLACSQATPVPGIPAPVADQGQAFLTVTPNPATLPGSAATPLPMSDPTISSTATPGPTPSNFERVSQDRIRTAGSFQVLGNVLDREPFLLIGCNTGADLGSPHSVAFSDTCVFSSEARLVVVEGLNLSKIAEKHRYSVFVRYSKKDTYCFHTSSLPIRPSPFSRTPCPGWQQSVPILIVAGSYAFQELGDSEWQTLISPK